MKKKICYLSVLTLFLFQAAAQDPLFLNANQSLISLNPSFAGSNGFARIQSSYQTRTLGRTFTYESYVTSVDAYLKPLRGGLAFSFLGDNLVNGLVKNRVFSLAYAQHFSFMSGRLKIIPSLQFSYGQKKVDLSLLSFITPLPQSTNSSAVLLQANPDAFYGQAKSYLDLTSGLLVNYKDRLFAGASVFHMNQPYTSVLTDYRLPYLLNLHVAYTFRLSEKSRLQLFYRHQQQKSYYNYQFGASLVIFNHLVTGIGCLNKNSPFFSAGYRNSYFSALLGYNLVQRKYFGTTAGTWQVNVSVNLREKARRTALSSFETQ